MRVRIDYAVEVSDEYRREINLYYGRPGLASREEVKNWFRANGSSMDDDLGYAAKMREEAAERDARVREEYGEEL